MYRILISQKLIHRVFRHLFLFLGMIILFSWIAYSGREEGERFISKFAMVGANALFFFGYAYLTVYLLIPLLLFKGRILGFFMAFLAAGLALSACKFLFSDFIFYQAVSPENLTSLQPVSFPALLMNTKDMTFIVAIFALAKFGRDRYVLDTRIREMKRWKLEAELELIGYQMDPHMIFNNFNSLYSISIYRPELLQNTVKSLRQIMYYLFRESRHEQIPLAREIEMISNYIGLERLRYGDRLTISFHKNGETGNHVIAPMILYSFVENCFEKGIFDSASHSWIRIDLKVMESRLTFRVAHSVEQPDHPIHSQEPVSSMDTSIRRLELSYPYRHTLIVNESSNEHRMELNLSM